MLWHYLFAGVKVCRCKAKWSESLLITPECHIQKTSVQNVSRSVTCFRTYFGIGIYAFLGLNCHASVCHFTLVIFLRMTKMATLVGFTEGNGSRREVSVASSGRKDPHSYLWVKSSAFVALSAYECSYSQIFFVYRPIMAHRMRYF